ncbi:unnamed protein product [Ambrosiozyma monospora]|uniref:Unnamed protein product n=1 Tax=Ambrosiozyma monospora TaxID=43982 RepID=A0A9W6SXX2_AMBMO|nr:unnamed protein product [Ambrosiozyma monospora]
MKFGSSTLLSVLSVATAVMAEEVKVFNWTTGWKDMNPDGVQERPVITCNGEWPWPQVRVNKGDRVIIYLNNGFEKESTSLHVHGLFQHNTTQMDGPPMLNQCSIMPGDTMIYNFTVPDQVGSYWYHSHSEGQYMDGMRDIIQLALNQFHKTCFSMIP